MRLVLLYLQVCVDEVGLDLQPPDVDPSRESPGDADHVDA